MIDNFKALQQAIADSPILAFPNFEKRLIIQRDASAKAMNGACLQGNHVDFNKAVFLTLATFLTLADT